MSDYIDREKLIQAISEDALTTLSDWDSSLMNLIMIEIQECPAADVAPVVHGHWIESKLYSDELNNIASCSRCGNMIDFVTETPTYCDDCGAKMDGGCEDA